MHPMDAKVALGKIMVTDFHSAASTMPRPRCSMFVVRRKEIPTDVPTCQMPEGVRVEGGVRVDKLLARVGLAESVDNTVRKIKAAVR